MTNNQSSKTKILIFLAFLVSSYSTTLPNNANKSHELNHNNKQTINQLPTSKPIQDLCVDLALYSIFHIALVPEMDKLVKHSGFEINGLGNRNTCQNHTYNQYYTMNIISNIGFPHYQGFCMPYFCEIDYLNAGYQQINSTLSMLMKHYRHQENYSITALHYVDPNLNESDQTPGEIIFLVIFFTLTAWVFISSLIIYCKCEQKTENQYTAPYTNIHSKNAKLNINTLLTSGASSTVEDKSLVANQDQNSDNNNNNNKNQEFRPVQQYVDSELQLQQQRKGQSEQNQGQSTARNVIICFSIVDNFRQLAQDQQNFFDQQDYELEQNDQNVITKPIIKNNNNNAATKNKKLILEEEEQEQSSQNSGKDQLSYFQMTNAIYTDDRELKESQQINLAFLNGLRCILFFWTCYGGTYLFRFQAIQNWTDQYYFSNSGGYFTLAAAANFCADTFFWISGFVATANILPLLQQQQQQKQQQGDNKDISENDDSFFLSFYLKSLCHRLLRLWPTYIFCVLIYWLLLPYMANGPIWNEQITNSQQCNTTWWRNFLLIDNLFPYKPTSERLPQPNGSYASDYCFQWGWFISNDWQFFILTPLLLWIYTKQRQIGVLVLFLLFAGSCVAGYLISYYQNFHFDFPSQINDVPQPEYFTNFYVKPYVRISTYIVGICLGLFYRAFEDNENWALKVADKLKRSILLRAFSILAGLALINWMIWCVIPLQYNGKAWSQAVQSLYLTFGRILFVLGVSLLFLPAIVKRKEILNFLFGAYFWKPIARLTYCASLVFFIVISRNYYAEQQLIVYSNWLFIYYCIADIVISIVIGCWIYMICEAPIFNFESFIYQKIEAKFKVL